MSDQVAPFQRTLKKTYFSFDTEDPREVNLANLNRLASDHGKGMLDWKASMVAMRALRFMNRLKIYSFNHPWEKR